MWAHVALIIPHEVRSAVWPAGRLAYRPTPTIGALGHLYPRRGFETFDRSAEGMNPSHRTSSDPCKKESTRTEIHNSNHDAADRNAAWI